MAMYFADDAIIVTNPEVSSVRDSDRILGILASKTKRAIDGREPIKEHLLLTRYDTERVEKGEMLSVQDVRDILAIPIIGIIPESKAVLKASNTGTPVILDTQSDAGKAYQDAIARFLGEDMPLELLTKNVKDCYVVYLVKTRRRFQHEYLKLSTKKKQHRFCC